MPAYTQTTIANLALAHLGDRRIVSLSDTNDTNAEVLSDNYDHAVGLAFELHDWIWARREAELAQLPATPTLRYGYYYQLPNNFARLSNLSENTNMQPALEYFQLSEGKLATDAASVFLEYVADDWDESQWPSFFAEVAAVQLAALSAPRISHSRTDRATLEDHLQKVALPRARVADSQLLPPRRRIVRSQWSQDRFHRGVRTARPDI